MRRTIIITLALLLLTVSGWAQPRPGSFTTLRASSILATALGSAAAPFITVTSDTNTGIYWTGSDAMGVTIDGTLRTTWSTTGWTLASGYQMFLPDGLVTAPAIVVGGDSDSGLYTTSTSLFFGQNMNGTTTKSMITISGAATPTMSFNIANTDRATLAAASLTLATGTALVLPKGTFSAPALAFTADADSGIYLDSSNFMWIGRDLSAAGPQILFNTSGSNSVDVMVGGTSKISAASTYVAIGTATLRLAPTIFGSLPGSPVNGDMMYCSDCTVASPCAGGGSGAFAKRINGAWVCN